jgi:hypothetical protein
MPQWGVEWLVVTENGDRTIPGLTFLRGQSASVRRQLLAILEAVRTTGPDQWRDSTSHDSMSGVCADLHEVRDRHDQTLYRLYLKWQRNERRVVIIDGAAKPNNTALPNAFYEDLATLAATTGMDPPPFATTDDALRLVFDDQD